MPITELNTLQTLTPAFNNNLLKVESSNVNKEKYQYIVDSLYYKITIQYLKDAINSGFPEYSGKIALISPNATDNYMQGDSVAFFDIVSGTYTGVYQVHAVPNYDTIILDAQHGSVNYNNQTNYLYKINRLKLPSSPDNTATFNVNGFTTGLIGCRFKLTDFGMFNIFENYLKYQYLANEEYYEAITGTSVANNGGLLELVSPSRLVDVGTHVQLIQTTGTTYNGIFEVMSINGSNLVLSKGYSGAYSSGWSANVFPKDVINTLTYADISGDKFAFNGAIPKRDNLSFSGTQYDATTTQPCKFLTTIPNGTYQKIDSKGYLQFFQSDKYSCSTYIIDVLDQAGATQQYKVNLNGVSAHMLGISVGIGDLNDIPLNNFATVPSRGIPVIQNCDVSYEVYLEGTTGCGIGGTQTVAFVNPLAPYVLDSNFWTSQQWGNTTIQVQEFKIDGVTQTITSSTTTYTPTNFTSQTFEEIYPDEIEAQTGGVLNVTYPITVVAPSSPTSYLFEMDINFNVDFSLKVQYAISSASAYANPTKYIDVEYSWDASECQAEYSINGTKEFQGIENGFIGMQGGGAGSIITLSEKKKFIVDWDCCVYTGARLIFQDRLGSMAGFNFDLKQYDDMTISTDGYEQNSFDVDATVIDDGFKTIQASYTHKITINSDFITEEEMTYLMEAFSSPNVYLQYREGIASCIILPGTRRITKKENSSLIMVTLDVNVNGTNFSQRN